MCFIATRQKTTFWDWNSNCFTACSDVNACLAINAWTCPQSRRHCIDGRCRCTAAWHRFYSVVSSYDAWFSVYIRKSLNSFVKYSYILFACFVSTLSEENKYNERINCAFLYRPLTSMKAFRYYSFHIFKDINDTFIISIF